MYNKRRVATILVALVLSVVLAEADDAKHQATSSKIPKGAKVFIAPMPDGCDTYLKDAIKKKKVPVETATSRDRADYEITGTSETQKACTARKRRIANGNSREGASITVRTIKRAQAVSPYSC